MDKWGFSGKIGFDPAADLSAYHLQNTHVAISICAFVWFVLVLAHVVGG